MRRSLATSILAVLVLTGCASVQPVAPSQVRVESKHIFEKNYSLGVEGSAYVGEPIVKVKDYYEIMREADVLAASESFRLNLPPFTHLDVPAGAIAEVRGTTSRNGKTYRVVNIKERTAALLNFLLNEDGSFEGSAINSAGAKMGYSYHPNPATARFVGTTVTKVDTSKGWKNFELIFSGVTKDSITVLYREYTPEDLARAAYSQNLVYPRESTSIRYRDTAITIIEASNERLRYVVKADGLK